MRVERVVAELLDVGHELEGGVYDEMLSVVERWNVWSVRNRKAVRELEWKLKVEEWEQNEQIRVKQQQEDDERKQQETSNAGAKTDQLDHAAPVVTN